MRPSSWNGVGAIAKVPAAWAVSFMTGSSLVSSALYCVIPGCATWRRPGIHTHDRGYGFRARDFVAPRNDGGSEPPRAHLDLFLGEEDLLGVVDDVLGLPAGIGRL